MEWVVTHEVMVRAGGFAGMFCLMLWLEFRIPNRQPGPHHSFSNRKIFNLGLTVTSTLALRLIPAVSALASAALAERFGWGLLRLIDTPLVAALLVSIIAMDCAIYLQHLASHHIPLLWRIHRVHHCDEELDATTALRFHPVEILLSAIYKSCVVVLLGAPAAAIIIFETLVNTSAIFNHANIRLPEKTDNMLRKLIVTPNMHTVHHSPKPEETNSNYGFFLSVWDRSFNTYRENETPACSARIGLDNIKNNRTASFYDLLMLPLRKN